MRRRKKGSQQSPARTRLLLILLTLVLLPAVFYSAYEISALSSSEALLEEIYRRQLDAVLFSVNQYAWDLASSWAGTLERSLTEHNPGPAPPDIETFLRNTPPLIGVFTADSTFTRVNHVHGAGPSPISDSALATRLTAERPLLQRLARLRASAYRKLEALTLGGTPQGDSIIALVFALPEGSATPVSCAGMIIDADAFVRTSLAPRLREAAGTDLAATVRNSRGDIVFSTTTAPDKGARERTLWLFPHLTLGIAPAGTTVEDIARSRFRRNLLLILMLVAILLAAAFLLYRTIMQQSELARLRTDFVSRVSHELRTPLALIRMYTETLELGRVPADRQHEYYATILSETERLSRLVNRILNFSRMEAGRAPYSLSPLDLNDVVRRILDTHRNRLHASGFDVSLEQSAYLPPVAADREAVTDAIMNLLDNAMKYSPNEKRIALRTGADTTTAYVEVEDRGIGIPREHHAKIFEKFYRVPDAYAQHTQGSGLGLALVHHIMDAHGGRVDVRSSPGKGSTFRLVFPVSAERPAGSDVPEGRTPA